MALSLSPTAMIIHKRAGALAPHLEERRRHGGTIGFVPTMGALHNGHISLITRALEICDTVVCSIFVNPTQFNDPKDLEKYPVTLEEDIHRLALSDADFLFLPTADEVYPGGMDSLPRYDLAGLDTLLEGEHRPGHFQGVCQVVHRLLNITRPDVLVMGGKDYQQCMVCRRLIETESLPVRLEVAQTVREPSGLAMSSRNRRLSDPGKAMASLIHAVLVDWRSRIVGADIRGLEVSGGERLEAAGFKVEYATIRDAVTLQQVEAWDGKRPVVGLVAAWLEGVRLIDNMTLSA